jgi:DNA-3-methyladenine glycosylase I
LIKRCQWLGSSADELYINYHDEEWGEPIHDDRLLFEFLILEGAQAGLSWFTILKRRENYRAAYDNFEPHKIAKYNTKKKESLLQDSGIIRNRLKIEASVANAQAFLKIVEEYGSFDRYIWQFVNYKTIYNNWKNLSEIPAETQESKEMSKDLRKHGFKFVGPTICYAFMQAVGMVHDHTQDCFKYKKRLTLPSTT